MNVPGSLEIPAPVRDIHELDRRVELYTIADKLLSDLPVVIGNIGEASDLTRFDQVERTFALRHHGYCSVDNSGVIYQGAPDTRGTHSPLSQRAIELVAPVVLLAASDAREFMHIPDDETVELHASLSQGNYQSDTGAAAPHLDFISSGLSYIVSTAPTTEYFPGTFTRDLVEDRDIDASQLHGYTFESGEVLRTNCLQFHRAQTLPKGQSVQRMRLIIDVENPSPAEL